MKPSDMRDEILSHVTSALDFLLARQSDSYPFLDTKFNIATGENFVPEDPLRGPDVIYTWIQGRGLEALAEHARWMRSDEIRALLPRVVQGMESARLLNGGRLPFMMRPDGAPVALDFSGPDPRTVTEAPGRSAGPCTLSDLFYAKGLAAAADLLQDDRLMGVAETLFAEVVEDLRSERFLFGQVPLDPKNPVGPVPGRFSHAGRMIAIGGAMVFFRATKKRSYAEIGEEFTQHILERHTQGAGPISNGFVEGDFWEFVNEAVEPWRTPEGMVWSDPGHAVEFTGLAFAHLRMTGGDTSLAPQLRYVLRQNFANGFTGRGIVKGFDLVKRHAVNADMPWWSLPEAMRAAALGALTTQGDEQAKLEEIFAQCWEAFQKHYVLPGHGSFAVQCLDKDGRVSKVIPAAPDADPCYHTGLSLLHCLPYLE